MTSDSERSSSAEKLPSDASTPDGNESTWIVGDDQANDRAKSTGSFELKKDDSPSLIGRYQVVSQLGRGGFGYVYKAWDPELKCDVAVKVPRWDRILRQGEMQRFREEARTLARIRNHPSIVTVYDIAETQSGIPFAVMEFVEGQTLSDYTKQHKLSVDDALQVLLQIAEALKAAHQLSIIHRDLKPSNVILDLKGNVTLVDFGLALHDDLTYEDLGNAVEGTAPYMAPEQIRGENHRIDGQTDIWAFGVMMYRLLTGKRPFRARETKDLARIIRYREAKPPRQLNPQIPKEIERICLKCLSKMMSDRYQSMPDLIDDLTDAVMEMRAPPEPIISDSDLANLKGHGLIADSDPSGSQRDSGRSARSARSGRSSGSGFSEPSQGQSLLVTYKGLRPFDSNDKDFFLELLPGMRTRDGVPESIQFWKSRIQGDELEPMTVGLIYGPSGCGKSSFVRAGLLPLLPTQVNPVYLECTAENTERRLARQIAHRIHSVNPEDSLPEILRQFRRGDHLACEDKLLIVLDQFEQWLHGTHDYENHELIEALRQCDGETITCILLIRDDFWMSTSEVMRSLEIPIREGHNALALPLFDERHARKVLVALGRSFQRLPGSTDDHGSSLNAQQKKLVREAVRSLSKDGKIICVHLAVFAQMMKDREWTAGEWRRAGGWEGLGILFLNGIFRGPQTPRVRRQLEAPAQKVLEHLLPDQASSIKGEHCSIGELRIVSGLESEPKRFADVFQCLAIDFPLISGLESSTDGSHPVDSLSVSDDQTAYHLTHDFLVEPISNWIKQVRKETWSGRALLRFEELTSYWTRTRDRRYLPTVSELIAVTFSATEQKRTPSGRSLLNAAYKHYGVICAGLVIVAVAGILLLSALKKSNTQGLVQNVIDDIIVGTPEQFEAGVTALAEHRDLALSKLRPLIENPQSRVSSRAACAMVRLQAGDPDVIDNIIEQIPELERTEFTVINSSLSGVERQGYHQIRKAFEETESPYSRARLALSAWSLGRPNLLQSMLEDASDRRLQSAIIDTFPKWHGSLDIVLDLLDSDPDPDLQYSICAALGRVSPKTLSELNRNRTVAMFHKLYHRKGDTGVNQVAAWALRNWDIQPAITPTTIQSLESESGGDLPKLVHLQVSDKSILTFVQVGRGELNRHEGVQGQWQQHHFYVAKENVEITPFYMSVTETNSALFKQYLEEAADEATLEHLQATKFWNVNSSEIPINAVSRIDCAKFTNWLSEINGLEPCYRIVDSQIIKNASASGFRLPDSDQWEFACKAGAATGVFWGSNLPDDIAEQYAHIGVRDDPDIAMETGQKIPNRFGFYDVIGNVSEICDPAPRILEAVSAHFQALIMGSDLNSGSHKLCGILYFPTADTDRRKMTGFRIVLPVPNKKTPSINSASH